jgi:2-polyprenyl-3-methyl-5-hydroxy-6-metoxy-1,4-benzoquinol methylase
VPHDGIYRAVNEVVLSVIPSTAMRILDAGCGAGNLGEILGRNTNREVVGITYSSREAELASSRLSAVYCADLNGFDFGSLGKFDCVILSHVLEHLYNPQTTLERLKVALTQESRVIVALPNVLWWKQRLNFIMGRWRYQDSGILDRTHLRFFDRQTSAELLCDAGYEIEKRIDAGWFPALKPVRGLLGPLADQIDRGASKLFPGLLAFQFVFVARLRYK